MPFLKKLGNAFEDFASAAVPAGTAYLLSGGNPLAAASAGAGGFKRNEEEERLRKMQLQQNKNQGMANLINQLSSRPNYQAKQAAAPSAGFLEQLAGGAQTGIQAYQAADMLARQKKEMDTKQREADANIASIQGADDAARRGLEEEVFTPGQSNIVGSVGKSGMGGRQDPYMMPEQTISAPKPTEPPPLGYLSGAAAERRSERTLDISESNAAAAVRASMAKIRQSTGEQLQLARLVATNPKAFENMGPSEQTKALLGLQALSGEIPQLEGLAQNLAGRALTPSQQDGLKSAQDALALMEEAKSLYADLGGFELDQNGNIVSTKTENELGVLGGRLIAPGSDDAKKMARLNQVLDQMTPVLFRMYQSGVMTKEDFETTRNLLPDPYAFGSEASQYSNMLNLLSSTQSSFDRWANALESTGYRTGSFTQGAGTTVDMSRVDAIIQRLYGGS